MRLIDADVLLGQMQPDSKFEINSYADAAAMAIANAYIKLVENQPTVEAPDINVGSMDITTHDSIPAETSENDEDRTSGDCISRQQAINAVYKNDRHTTIRQRLDALPSAQPETAKRIVGKSRDGMTLWYQCDTCNEPVDAQDNYCRGCGRRLIDE